MSGELCIPKDVDNLDMDTNIDDVKPGCSSSPYGKPCGPTNKEVYEFFKANKYLDSESVITKYKEQFADPVTNELEADSTTIYNSLNKLYKKVTYNLRGKSCEEFLNNMFIKPRSKAAFLSDILHDSPQKVKLRKELQKTNKSNLELKRKLDDSYEVIEEMDKELKSLADDYEKKMNNMAFMEQQYGNVITRMLNERTDDKSVNNKLSKELTELQHRYEETSKKLSIAEKTLSSIKN